jgi:hypothetical protein
MTLVLWRYSIFQNKSSPHIHSLPHSPKTHLHRRPVTTAASTTVTEQQPLLLLRSQQPVGHLFLLSRESLQPYSQQMTCSECVYYHILLLIFLNDIFTCFIRTSYHHQALVCSTPTSPQDHSVVSNTCT